LTVSACRRKKYQSATELESDDFTGPICNTGLLKARVDLFVVETYEFDPEFLSESNGFEWLLFLWAISGDGTVW
jgi:hypothetical protein